MKHIMILTDKLMFLLDRMGMVCGSHYDEKKVKKFLVLLEEYTDILDILVTAHKNERYMNKLHKLHIDDVDNWTNHVSDAFKKLHNLLSILKEDIIKLNDFFENNPEKLSGAVGDLAMGMVMTGLREEEGVMKHLREAAIFDVEDLDKLIHNKTHLAGIHKWIGFLNKDDAHQVMEREIYFAELIGN